MTSADYAFKTQTLINEGLELTQSLSQKDPARAAEIYAELAKAQAMVLIAKSLDNVRNECRNLTFSLDTNLAPLKLDLPEIEKLGDKLFQG
ncbi:MAG: hypothetical protein R2880_17220 [Deinococcales bacterium]